MSLNCQSGNPAHRCTTICSSGPWGNLEEYSDAYSAYDHLTLRFASRIRHVIACRTAVC